jgi:hypothetical protein
VAEQVVDALEVVDVDQQEQVVGVGVGLGVQAGG